ncbi:MAG: site-2 protease family protein [Thermoplasmata archaeon]|nr:site-2 protease family protein [Thermoplasmata archaeon]
MSTAYLVLLILLIVYIPIWVWVWRNPERAARWHLQKYGPCIMIKTQLGMKTMDRFARYPRFWHAFGFCSKLISAVLFLLMMYMLIVAVIAIPSRLASGSSIGIEYALAIPGFNPIMPLSYGVVALFFAMVVHELGHGIQARVNGIHVDSSGLLYGVVPLGAFVEPNEEEMATKPRKAQIDVYAAGITVNTVFAVISIILMVFACSFVSSDYGDSAGVYYVDADSPAYDAGIPASALIIGISDADGNLLVGTDVNGNQNGTLSTVTSGSAAYIDYPLDPTQRYYVTYMLEDGTHQSGLVQLGLYIKAVTSGSGANNAGITAGSFIYSITINGTTTKIDGYQTFTDLMSSTSGGEQIVVTTVSVMDSEGTYTTTDYDVTLSTRNSIGFLGVTTTMSGLTFTTPDLLMEAAVNPFYNVSTPYSYVTSLFSYLSGPFNGMDPISDEVKWWYDAPGGDLTWVFIKLMYWIFWLDILLAISNALPTYVLDGGFIFAGGVNWFLEKLRIGDEERRRKLTDSIAGSVSTVVLFLFLLVILAMVV